MIITKPFSARHISEANKSPSVSSGIGFTSKEVEKAVVLAQVEAGSVIEFIVIVVEPVFVIVAAAIGNEASPLLTAEVLMLFLKAQFLLLEV